MTEANFRQLIRNVATVDILLVYRICRLAATLPSLLATKLSLSLRLILSAACSLCLASAACDVVT